MIVSHHFACHGNYIGSNYNKNLIGVQFVYSILLILGKVGVVTFILIGSYFLCKKDFTWYRPINLFIQMIFYSYTLFLIAIAFFPSLKKLVNLKTFLFPIPLPSGYWFVNSYLIMLLLIPLLNLIINSTNKRQLLFILYIIFIVWNVFALLGNLFPGKLEFSSSTSYNNFSDYTEANYFLYIYLIGGYLRNYPPKWLNNLKKSLELLIVSITVVIIFTAVFNTPNFYSLYARFAIQLNNPFSLIISLFLFATFKNFSLGKKTFINTVAKSMFGVYLIHDNTFVRIILWNYLINSSDFLKNGMYYFLMGIYYSTLIFIICVFIDTIKRLLFNSYLNKLSEFISLKLRKITNSLKP